MPRTRGHRHRCQDERGSGGLSLAWVLLTPVLLALIFGGIAMAFRMYGENLALDAANAAARAAAVLPVSADRGRQAAQEFLDENAAGTLSGHLGDSGTVRQQRGGLRHRAHPDPARHGVPAVLPGRGAHAVITTVRNGAPVSASTAVKPGWVGNHWNW